jgi:hypothetical protein
MKMVFFGEVLPREVHYKVLKNYPNRVVPRMFNELFNSYFEAFVQLGYEVHSVIPSFARSAIEAEFGINSSGGGLKASVDPRTGIHYHYFNNDGSRFSRLFHKLCTNFQVLAEIRRQLKTTKSTEQLIIGNYCSQIVYALPCVLLRNSRFGRRSNVKYWIFEERLIAKPNSFLLKLIDNIQWRLMKAADALLVVTEYYGREVTEPRTGVPYYILPNVVSESLIQQYRQIEHFTPKNTSSQFIVVYTGGVYSRYAFDSLIETIRLAETKYPGKYRWRFAGSGELDLTNQLQELAARPNSGVEFLGPLDATELIKLQKSADLLISLRKIATPEDKLWGRYANSGKLFDYMLAARPALTTDGVGIDSGMRPFLNFIDSTDPEDLLAAIERICEHPPSQELLEQGRDYIIEHYSPAPVTRELKAIFEQISMKYS